MFIRKRRYKTKSGKINKYLQLVESYREKGKVRLRVISSFSGFTSLEQAYVTYKHLETTFFSEEDKLEYPDRYRLYRFEGMGAKWLSYNSIKKKREQLEQGVLALSEIAADLIA